MSLVSTAMWYTMSLSRASDAEYNWMKAADGRRNLINQAANPNLSFGSGLSQLHEKDKNYGSSMAMNSMLRNIYNAQADSAKKMLDDNIKRSFSYYA
jgi:hypothetical protein